MRIGLLLHHFIWGLPLPLIFRQTVKPQWNVSSQTTKAVATSCWEAELQSFWTWTRFTPDDLQGKMKYFSLKYSVVLQSSQTVLGYISFATTPHNFPLTHKPKRTPQHNYFLLHQTNSSYWWSALSNQLWKGKHTNLKNTDKRFSTYKNKQL